MTEPVLPPTNADGDAIAAVQRALDAMPPVAAMRVQVVSMARGRMRLRAPLAYNVNDKGCAFGGSLAGLMTLACWSLGTAVLRQRGLGSELFVQDSQLRYLAPLFADLEAEAWLDPAEDWDAFTAALAARGKARATLCARVLLPEGGEAATLRGRFVALQGSRSG